MERASGEMELCSLNMDVIFRAEQKERRGTSERAGEGGYGMRKEWGIGLKKTGGKARMGNQMPIN